MPTKNANGVFVPDSSGRRPGIYTYLSGPPNVWSRAKVDHNLRPTTGHTTASAFDRASVMLYRFPALFYRTSGSPCAPSGDGQDLSEGDGDGLDLLYPGAEAPSESTRRRYELLQVLEPPMAAMNMGLESEPSPADRFRAAAAVVLKSILL